MSCSCYLNRLCSESRRVPTRQGKVREKWNFAKVGEMSGNFDECQGNLKNKAKVREMSGNFEQTVREFSSIGI